MQLNASAPGSLMLLGEYGVLYGKHALVCAVDKRISIIFSQRQDDYVEIEADGFGKYATSISQLTIEKPFDFVLGVLKYYQGRLKQGCTIHITSDFSSQIGLGSSAAVTVAMMAALLTSLNIRTSPLDLLRQSRQVIRQIQGVGSGADVAASVYGGIVNYQAHPLMAEKLSVIYPLTVMYSGFKTPTVEAISKVQRLFFAYPHLFRELSNTIGQCAVEGHHAVRREDWKSLGQIMSVQQGMMESLGVSTPLLRHLVDDLYRDKNILGAKISGAGLGDCVIGLGEASVDYQYEGVNHDAGSPVKRILLAMTSQGVQCEKI